MFIGDTTFIELSNGYSVILNLVDAFSKYAWSQPIKIQNAINIKKAIEKVFNLIKLEFNIPINRIQFDKGTEFKNEIVEDLLKSNNIKVSYSSAYNFKSQSIVERFHQTLKRKLYIYMSANQTQNWPDVLQIVVNNYNNSRHSTTNKTPLDILNNKPDAKSIEEVLAIFRKKQFDENIDNDLFKGDSVRILHQNFIERQKNKLLKGYVQQWSNEIYVISKVIKPRLSIKRRYTISELDASSSFNKQYFRWQLQKINKESLENTKIDLTKIIKSVPNIPLKPLQEIKISDKNSEILKSIELFIVTLEYVNVKDIKEILKENNISINLKKQKSGILKELKFIFI